MPIGAIVIWQSLGKVFLEALGILALVALAFEGALRSCRSDFCRQISAGLLFGAGACASMAIPNEIMPGIFFDMRHVFIMLSAPFAGMIATLMTAMAACLARFYHGGVGMTVGVVGIGISAAIAMTLVCVLRRDDRAPWIFPLYGACASLALLSLAFLPSDTAWSLLKSAGPALIAGNFIGVVAGAHLLHYQQQRLHHERALAMAAKRDTLTGLLNRRAFDEEASALVRSDAREPTAVMMIDIDRFKMINDSYGHAAGDDVLRSVGRAILDSARGSDIVARYGGEEFALLLPGSTAQNANTVAARIHAALAQAETSCEGDKIDVTVSIGVCALAHLSDRPLRVALQQADAALYDAKRAGRNRTVFSPAA